MRSVVAKAYEQITADGTVKLFESYRVGIRDGEQTRDFLYVKDAVAIALHLGRTPGARGLYNVGGGVARTWNDLAGAIFTALERPRHITYVPMPDALRGKYQYRTEATVDKLRASGYDAPFITLEEGVWDYVRRYLVPGVILGGELDRSASGAGSALSTPASR
jgi:ADP-L-glycero-D-manno-heptose 6-epimerase